MKTKYKNLKKNIKIIVFDVDGTMTDGKIYMGNNGEIMKAFDIKDGCGIHDILPLHDIIPVIITARDSKIVANRCRELNIEHCYQGIRDKANKLKEVASVLGCQADEKGIYQNVAYVGDDIIDLSCMKICSVIACPADAVKEVKRIANFISSKNSGNGVIRDFIDWLCR